MIHGLFPVIEAIEHSAAPIRATRPSNVTDGHVRSIVNLTRAMEAALSRGDRVTALLGLATLRDVLVCHFAREERAMEALEGYDTARHAHEHQALLSGLYAIQGAIVAGNLARLTDQVAAYLNRASRHAVEHDVPLSECLYAG